MSNGSRRIVASSFAALIVAGCSEAPPSTDENAAAEPEPQLACEMVVSGAEAMRATPSAGNVVNRLDVLANGRFRWNDAEIDAATLEQYLGLVSQMSPQPTLAVSFEAEAPASARRELSDMIARALNCRATGI